jgi:anti-anti-sigma factor
MRKLTVVSPVYNEERVIVAFHEELRRTLAGLAGWECSVLYVVDRGSDRSLELLRALAAADPGVSVLALSSRFGQQAALLAGLDHSDADAVVMLDSDLQHPPAVIPELVARHEQGFDVVYTVRENDASLPLVKRLSARTFYGLVNAISETPIRQGAADFRLLARSVVEVFQKQVRELVGQGKMNLIVDMSQVSWVNSTGLGILIAGYGTVKKAGGVLKLIGVNKRIDQIFMVTKLHTIFETFEEEAQALASF